MTLSTSAYPKYYGVGYAESLFLLVIFILQTRLV